MRPHVSCGSDFGRHSAAAARKCSRRRQVGIDRAASFRREPDGGVRDAAFVSFLDGHEISVLELLQVIGQVALPPLS